MNRGEFEKVEELFKKCFSETENVDLCRLYVSYVRRVNDIVTGGEKSRVTVIQAFEFALSKVGIDIFSNELWKDYLNFLESWTPGAIWEKQQKIDLIRKVYKKFLTIPTKNIESYWSQYAKWENEINSSTSNKFISEKSSEFMIARSWNKEWQRKLQNLDKSLNSECFRDENSKHVNEQLLLWKIWIEMEKENKLELNEDSLRQRILYVYKQSVSSLPFISELWFNFAKHILSYDEEANISTCISLLSYSVELNRRSMLLNFFLAELYEKENFTKSKEVYYNILNILLNDYNTIINELNITRNQVFGYQFGTNLGLNLNFNSEEKKIVENQNNHHTDIASNTNFMDLDGNLNNSTSNEIDRIENNDVNIFEEKDVGSNDNDYININYNEIDLDEFDRYLDVNNSNDSQDKNTNFDQNKAKQKEFLLLKKKHLNLTKTITLVYMRLMNACKRFEGLKEARLVFKISRKNFTSIGFEMYVENAYLEHFLNNFKIALKIFDLAYKIKKFTIDGNFLLAYLKYLVLINDVDNIKKFVQASNANLSLRISSLKKVLDFTTDRFLKFLVTKEIEEKNSDLKILYKTYIEYAFKYISLDAVLTFTNKYEKLFVNDNPIDLFTDRYCLNDENLIKKLEIVNYSVNNKNNQRFYNRSKFDLINKQDITDFRNYTSNASDDDDSHNTNKSFKNKKKEQFVKPTIIFLLKNLPNASYFNINSQNTFDSKKLVHFFANLSINPTE